MEPDGTTPAASRRPSLRERMPPSLWKMSVSLFCFLLSFFATGFFAGKDRVIWSLSVGLFIAGVSFVAQFLFDVEQELNGVKTTLTASTASTETLIDARIRQITEATELYAMAHDANVKIEALHSLVESLAKVRQRSPLVRDLVAAELERFVRFAKDVADSTHVAYDGEDRDWLLTLASSPLTSIDTVSIVTVESGGQIIVDGGPSRSDRARRYFDAQLAALQAEDRHAVIRRIFVVQQLSEDDQKAFDEFRESQEAAGIDTRVLDLSSPTGRRYRTLPEFIVFNAEACYEPSPAARTIHGERPILISTRLDFDPARVRKQVQLFARLWEALA
jgi:hypothetical protein